MTTVLRNGNDQQLQGDLDRLVQRAGKVLRQAYLGTRSRHVICRTLALSFLFALPLLLVELVRYVAGYASFGLHGWQYAALAAGAAIVFGLGWLLRDVLVHIVPRGRTLGLFDRQLRLANRLTTADEFIGAGERTGFMRAAIDDAVEPVRRAMGSEARADGSDRRWPLSHGALLSVPATVCLLALTVWLGGLQRVDTVGEWTAASFDEAAASPDLSIVARVDEEASSDEQRLSSDDMAMEQTPGAELGETADAGVPESFDGSGAQSGSQPALLQSDSESSAGRPSGGVSSGAGSQPAGQAAGGQRSAGDRRPAGEQNRQASDGDSQRPPAQEQAGGMSDEGERSANSSVNSSAESTGSESAAGGDPSAASGEESMAGNESSAMQTEIGQGDQSTEQQAAGQPSTEASQVESYAQSQVQGQRSGQSSPAGQDGSGVGEGQSASNDAIKKNRGAAKAMLAVPKPDRLIGVRGEGPEQIRQERSVPQEQQAPPVAANARSARGERIGTLQQTEVSGWSRQLVMNYFDRPGSAPGEIASDTPSTTTDSSEGQQP